MSSSRLELLTVTVLALLLTGCATSKRLAANDAKTVRAAASDVTLAPSSVLTPIGLVVDKPNRPFELARAGLRAEKPRKWRTRRRDGALIYQGPMRLPTVVLFEPSGRTLDEAVAGLSTEIGAVMGRVRIGRRVRDKTVAGYPAKVLTGTGRAEGHAMRWRATVIDGDRIAVVLVLGPSFMWGAASNSAAQFERSLRRN